MQVTSRIYDYSFRVVRDEKRRFRIAITIKLVLLCAFGMALVPTKSDQMLVAQNWDNGMNGHL